MPKEPTSLQDVEKYSNIKIDGAMTVGSCDAPSFVRYLLKLSNGMKTFSPVVAEIGMLASGYPGKNMDVEQKITYLRKLEQAGVNLFP